ncbi:hypothetical protein BD626DRAFT_503824 [Schizophyllum amplum]|uniref:Uncharacterized protein n=1 Tax=Schizophyllum amplum TaxID=97359 RepID=A0A550C7J0_9AGAR|nr:hypothetical protein BD626DRAFT_503824 [Auriculariopsis ampla]
MRAVRYNCTSHPSSLSWRECLGAGGVFQRVADRRPSVRRCHRAGRQWQYDGYTGRLVRVVQNGRRCPDPLKGRVRGLHLRVARLGAAAITARGLGEETEGPCVSAYEERVGRQGDERIQKEVMIRHGEKGRGWETRGRWRAYHASQAHAYGAA